MPLGDLLYMILLGKSQTFLSPPPFFHLPLSPPLFFFTHVHNDYFRCYILLSLLRANHTLVLTNITFPQRWRNRHPPQRRQDPPLLRPLHRHQRQRARNPNRLRLIRHPARRRLVLLPDHPAARHPRQGPRPPHRRRRHPHRQDGRRQRRIPHLPCRQRA